MTQPLHIIIDSADGLGKTTVCKMLSERLKIPVIKMADMPKYFHKDPESAAEVYNKTVVQFKDSSFIQDRGWTTSFIYTSVYGREFAPISYLMEEVIGQLDEKVFILTGSKPFRGDHFVTPEKWKLLNATYKAFNSQKVEVHHINVVKRTPKQVVDEIIKKLK